MDHFYQLIPPIISSQALATFLKNPDVIALSKILDPPEFKYMREHRNLIVHPTNMPNFKKLNKDLKYLQEASNFLSDETRIVIQNIKLHLPSLESIHDSVTGFKLVRPR